MNIPTNWANTENIESSNDENRGTNAYGPVTSVKSRKSWDVTIENEEDLRRRCTTLGIYDWPRARTPKRREMFKYAKVSLRSSDSKFSRVPRLAVISGITHATWNKSIQALFSTQNCDAMFSLGIAIIYFQRIMTRVARLPPGDVVTIGGEAVALDGPIARNMFFIASVILAMKYCDDLHLSNRYLSRVFKLPLAHINAWELLSLQHLQWRLGYTDAEKAQIGLELASHVDPFSRFANK